MHKISSIGYTPIPYDPQKADVRASQKRREFYAKMLVGIFCTMNIMWVAVALYGGYFSGMNKDIKDILHFAEFILASPVLFYTGSEFFKGAYYAIKNRQANMDLSIAAGASIAYFYSVYAMLSRNGEVYFDSVAMIITFVFIGKFLEVISKKKSIDALDSLGALLVSQIYVKSNDKFELKEIKTAEVAKILGTLKLEGKTLVCLKPCDTYSFNQLIKEHRVDREKAYIVGVGCKGKLDIEKAKKAGIKGIESVSGAEMTDACDTLTFQTLYGEKTLPYAEVMLERCHVCKGKEHMVFDEVIGESRDTKDAERFAEVEKIEAMSPEEKFAFFQKELSKCIRCNACRNVCPACSCRKCVFDSNKFDSAQKANVDSFEEKMFHVIRAFHVAGRCTDCGECSRVCPQGIPLHLFNRKFIKYINELYGEFQAGADTETRGPLTNFTFDDAEPSIVTERG